MRKAVTVILFLGLVINSLASLSSLDVQNAEIIGSAISTESAVISFFSLYTLPFTIMKEAVRKDIVLCDQLKNLPREQKKQEKNVPGNTADCLLNPFASEVRLVCGSNDNYGRCIVSVLAGVWGGNSRNHGDRRSANAVSGFISIFLLTYLILLSRSNLPWAITNIIRAVLKPNFGLAKLGFLVTVGGFL